METTTPRVRKIPSVNSPRSIPPIKVLGYGLGNTLEAIWSGGIHGGGIDQGGVFLVPRPVKYIK